MFFNLSYRLKHLIMLRMAILPEAVYRFNVFLGFSDGSVNKESACNVRGPGLNPWVGKIPWRRAWQPTPVLVPGESPWTEEPGRAAVHGVTESQTRPTD